MSNSITATRLATSAYFLACGVAMACWATLVPYAKARLHLDDARMGAILLALGAGALIGMPLTGELIRRLGSRVTMLLAGLALAIVLPLLALTSSPWSTTVALFFFGALIGTFDVSMNAHAVLVERRAGRAIMSSLHGLYSAGGIVGAIGVGAALSRGIPPLTCLLGVSAISAVLLLSLFPKLLPKREDDPMPGTALILPRGLVLAFGLLTFVAFLAEGAVLDWSAIFLHFELGYPKANAGIAYALFSATMTLGRVTGDWISRWLGPVSTVRIGALSAAAGYAVVVFVPEPLWVVAGFALVGMGLSNVVPVLFSAVGRLQPPNPPSSISIPVVTTIGYLGLLAGPALIGFVGEAVGLGTALGGVGALVLVIAACAKLAK